MTEIPRPPGPPIRVAAAGGCRVEGSCAVSEGHRAGSSASVHDRPFRSLLEDVIEWMMTQKATPLGGRQGMRMPSEKEKVWRVSLLRPAGGTRNPRKNEATRGHDGEPPGKKITVLRLPLFLALFHTRQQSSKWMSPGTMQLQDRCQESSGSPNRSLQLPSRRIDVRLVSVTESRARSATRLQTGVAGGHLGMLQFHPVSVCPGAWELWGTFLSSVL